MGAADAGRAARLLGAPGGRRPLTHLDTSFLIRALAPGSPHDARLRQWLERREGLAISAVAWTEFLCGPVGEREAELARAVVGEPVDFTRQEAEAAARLFNLSGRRRGTLADCMIAAAALGQGARLATADPEDFERFTEAGLAVVTA